MKNLRNKIEGEFRSNQPTDANSVLPRRSLNLRAGYISSQLGVALSLAPMGSADRSSL